MTQAVCFKNKFGYCRYSDSCRFKHVTIVCDDGQCEIQNCEKRHPKICRYYRDYRRCKFTVGCKYKHENPNDMFNKLEKELDKIKKNNSYNEKENHNKILEEKLKKIEKKLDTQQKDFDNQRKDLEAKKSHILGLEIRLDELEKKYKSEKLTKDKKIKELEILVKNKGKRDQDSFKCSDCEFVSKSRNGLKTHKAKMHTKTKESEYPAECELCEAKLPSEKDMKEHLRLHTYKRSTFKCEDCDFCSENFLTMEVHVGKQHSENFECGLCNYEAKDIEALNLHLTTCQIYVCEDCYFRTQHMHDIREHLKDKHNNDFSLIIHAKINLKDPETIDQILHSKEDLC